MQADLRAVLESGATVSDKIRALARAGHPRAEIARLLGKRYQHVRNVLVEDERQRGALLARKGGGSVTRSELAESGTAFLQAPATAEADTVVWLDVTADGHLQLPEQIKTALGVEHGGRVMVELNKDGTASLNSVEAAIRQVQAIVRRFVPQGVSLADELIAERRAEAAREAEGG